MNGQSVAIAFDGEFYMEREVETRRTSFCTGHVDERNKTIQKRKGKSGFISTQIGRNDI